MPIVLALGASLSWGFGDFFGPLKGRTLGTLRVLLYVEVFGLVPIAVVVAARGQGTDKAAVLLAIPAAIIGTTGLYAYFRGAAIGALSILSPIAGVSAVVPVVFGIATGDQPSTTQLAGMACALVGVFFTSWTPGRIGGRFAAGAGYALIAAICFGAYFPAMHAAGHADYWWATLIFRLTSTTLVLAIVLTRRPLPALGVPLLDLPMLAAVGVADTLGNLCFAAASVGGLVSVTSVLASLYPIVTVVLARIILRERVARSQEGGIVLTLLGIALISA
ncbi:MAG TPA: DMT family transporter [Gaiellaceae bacterium]|nr:DMT family transporter [Gaiellaceae bacterium]